MPYYIESDNPDCDGWATVKEDGEMLGCHNSKQGAIDQMVALSLEEGIDPGGERDTMLDKMATMGVETTTMAETSRSQPEHGNMETETITRERESVVRMVDFRAAKSADGTTLDGYGAVFNEWTNIEDQMGVYREKIAPGAFRRTLGMRTPVLQFDHGAHPLIGSIPLGRITSISEDDHGLRVKARLSDNWLVQPVRDAIRDGGVSGMSFRFRVIDETWERSRTDGMEERTIREVELYEVGPVVFPAYEQTSVGVRSRQALDALQDPEVRDEIARILANGTDLESLAMSDDPAESHSEDEGTPEAIHVPVRNRTQRQARVAMAKIPKG